MEACPSSANRGSSEGICRSTAGIQPPRPGRQGRPGVKPGSTPLCDLSLCPGDTASVHRLRWPRTSPDGEPSFPVSPTPDFHGVLRRNLCASILAILWHNAAEYSAKAFWFLFCPSNQIRGQIEGKTEGRSDSSLYGASGRPWDATAMSVW